MIARNFNRNFFNLLYKSFILYNLKFPVQNENLAVARFGTKVLQGEMRSALLDGNTFHYDMEKGYTRHQINEVEDHGILIRLGTQALVNHIKMLLWDKDLRFVI